MKTNKTIADFKKEVIKLKQKYQEQKMSFNWNYNFKEEDEETFAYFMITNHHQAVKVLFDKENSILVIKDLYTMDVKTMLELQGTL